MEKNIGDNGTIFYKKEGVEKLWKILILIVRIVHITQP